MPTSLPVPSKGALRALRQLAFGTSCTVAIGAGLLTEDRRRRIHSAREVHDNAKRLKSSRHYHSTGTTSLEAIENQVSRYRDEAFWLPSNVSKSTTPGAQGPPTSSDATTAKAPRGIEQSPVLEVHGNWAQPPKRTRIPPLISRRPLKSAGYLDEAKHRVWQHQTHQRKIAADLLQFLDRDLPDVEGAANLFLKVFEEELASIKSGLLPELIEASARVAVACQQLSMLTTSSRITDTVLKYGPVTEEDFNKFRPCVIINQWISMKGKFLYTELDADDLQKACSLYLTKFTEKPKSMSEDMRLIGERLCRATYEQGLFVLTLALFFRIEQSRAGNLLTSVDCLIKATHSLGRHKKVIRHFQKLYAHTNPNQTQFFQVTSLAIDSALTIGRLDEAERVLAIAGQMAKAGGLELSTTWILRIIGEEYRAHRDLVRLQGLFRRLLPLSSHMRHPQAIYSAMIQFCVEAHQEELAASYYKELREHYKRSPEDLRIHGHFALAKAYRGDWDGVKVAFDDMKHSIHKHPQEFSATFTPILKEFAKHHSVDAIEDFMQYFIGELHLKMTPLILSAMIDVYSKVHEVDAIFRWISYATANGCVMNSRTFNTILKNCANNFRFNYDEVYSLYRWGRDNRSDLVNNDSLAILRSTAVFRSANEAKRSENLQKIKRLDEPVQVQGSNEVYRAMTITYAQNKGDAVLEIFKSAQRDNIRLQTRHLALAVRASLQLSEGKLDETAGIIQSARANGIDITAAVASVFIHQISDLYAVGGKTGRGKPEDLVKRAEEAINSFAMSGLEVSQMAITHTASILQKRGRSRMAINFWDFMSRRFNIPRSTFDLATLTTLLNAYIGYKDADGVQWVIKTLSANKLTPDGQLKGALKEARKEAGRKLDQNPYSEWLHRWWEVLNTAHAEVKDMRHQACLTNQQVRRKVINIMAEAIEDQASVERAGSTNWATEQEQSADAESIHVGQEDIFWKEVDIEPFPVSSRLAALG